MSLIHGLAAHAAGAELLPFRYDPGELGLREVEIGITHCAICYSDVHLISNDWGISQYPFIPGHEIVGTVTAAGGEVRSLHPGQRVGLGWQSNSCGLCEWCTRGQENLCPRAEATCVHRHGGYATSVRANVRFVVPIPEALPSCEAAPLLCGGLTVYNPLRTHGIGPSSRVGVVGIGGLGHIAVQFARVFGAEITAFSSTAEKEGEAREMGAHHFVSNFDSKAVRELAGSLDLIISTVNAKLDWNTYLQALRPTGTLCFVGVTPAPVAVQAGLLISGQRSITGSPIGSPHRLREMLEVAARHGVKARTVCFAMARANEAVDKVKKYKVRYRAVLEN